MGEVQRSNLKMPQAWLSRMVPNPVIYNRLNGQTRTIVDAVASGTLLSKTAEEAHRLLEEISANNC